MKNSTCSISGCGKPTRTRQWCVMHYRRWLKHGDTSTGPRQANTQETFWAKVRKTQDCWHWEGALKENGYGRARYDGKAQPAHRLSYLWAGGSIPAGAQIDHICHNRACVRPEHLQAVTPKQNQENRAGAQRNSKSGSRGVYFHTRDKVWVASVGHKGGIIPAGRFKTLAEADAAVISRRNQLHKNNLLDRTTK